MPDGKWLVGIVLQNPVDKKRFEEAEWCFNINSKLSMFKEFVYGVLTRLYFKLVAVAFKHLCRHADRNLSQEQPICGASKESVQRVLFECPP